MWYALLVVARMAVLVYLGMLLLLVGCQRSMMYYPTRMSEEAARALAAADRLAPWTANGVLMGWRLEELDPTRDAILLFHGNAGFAAQRGYFAQGFAPDLDVYILEYPGYGTRPGTPGERHFYEAAETAFEQLEREREGRIFVGGESIGTGVASYLAGRFPDRVAGVFLSTPFYDLVEVARYHYPVFPVRWLLRDRYPSGEHLRSYQGPVAFLIAGEDEVVPARFGLRLYEAYAGPKRLWSQEDRSHNTLNYMPGNPWWDEVIGFFKQHP